MSFKSLIGEAINYEFFVLMEMLIISLIHLL